MPLSVSLFLLGFGWNLCFVGGSALFSDGVLPVERGRAQGVNDLLVNGASAVGSLAGGLIFAAAGFLTIALLGAALALVPLMLALRLRVPVATTPAVHRL
jgi:predicted MFS family arabinose efflux permease